MYALTALAQAYTTPGITTLLAWFASGMMKLQIPMLERLRTRGITQLTYTYMAQVSACLVRRVMHVSHWPYMTVNDVTDYLRNKP